MARYECSVCGYVYDEDQEGVPWDALSGDWTCPGCGAAKDLFLAVAAEVTSGASQASSSASAEGVPVARNTAIEPPLAVAKGAEKAGTGIASGEGGR